MIITSNTTTIPSAFDTLFDSYWQDYQLKLPVAGGMVYQDELYACQLDDSLDSLKRLDRLLLALKKNLSDSEQVLLERADFRHFVLFVSYYAGRVLAHQTHKQISWQPTNIKDGNTAAYAAKFYTALAAIDSTTDSSDAHMPPFFALMVVAAKLFGRFDYKFTHPIHGQPMPESLYWAVRAYLDNAAVNPTDDIANSIAGTQAAALAAADDKQHPSTHSQAIQNQADLKFSPTNQQPNSSSDDEFWRHATVGKTAEHAPSNQAALSQSPSVQPKPAVEQTKQQDKLQIEQPIHMPRVSAKSSAPLAKATKNNAHNRHAYLDELKMDLQNLTAVNHSHQAHYDKAMTVIHALSSNITQADAFEQLDAKPKQAVQQALQLLVKLVKAGNSNAMLALAVIYFEGVLIKGDAKKAASLVKKAADMGDIRAQKLLSRLYYQGIGVEASTQLGEMWLNKAADNGHPEAKNIQNQFDRIRLMQDDFRIESQKDQRYLMAAAVIGLFFVLMIWLTIKFLA